MTPVSRLPTVLFISGYGRSGSTVLERVVGQIPGFTAAGELCHVWERGFVEGQLCGCGQPFSACEVWNQVRASVFGPQSPGPEAVMQLQKDLLRARRMLPLLRPRLQSERFSRVLARYREMLHKLIAAIAATGGSQVVIDSSKNPLHGLVLAGLPEVDLRVIHLVRDSRAVAYSWMRKRVRPEIPWRETLMPIFSPARSAAVWHVKSRLSDSLQRRVRYSSLVRYEDFVADPRGVLARMLTDLGFAGRAASLDHIHDNEAILAADHTAAGNPMRFENGTVTLTEDEQWREQMSAWHRFQVTSLTWPLLYRYGYLGVGRERGG